MCGAKRAAAAMIAALAMGGGARAQMLESGAPVETLDPRLETGRACDQAAGDRVVDYVNGFLTTWMVCGKNRVPQAAQPLTFAYLKTYVPDGWSGVVVDAPTLRLAQGPVAEGGELLSVQVRHGVAATLRSDVDVRTGLGGRKKVVVLTPGTALYGLVSEVRVDSPFASLAPRFNWCAVQADAKALCFPDMSGRGDALKLGYGVQRTAAGESALAPARFDGAMLFAKSPPARVEYSAAPFPAAMTLRVVLRRATPDRLELQAELVDGTVTRPLRSESIRREGDGSGVLEAFGGRIALRPSGGGFSATVEKPPVADAVFRFLQTSD